MILDDESLHSLMGLDEPMERFIQNYVDSFIKWEIIQHLHEYPAEPLKAPDLAKTLNRPLDQIRRELQELAKKGLLSEKKGSRNKGAGYALSAKSAPEHDFPKRIADFISLCHTREGRLRVIYKILKNGKPIAA